MDNSQEIKTTNQDKPENKSERPKLSREWNFVTKDYKLKKVVGTGQYGQVVKAKCRKSGKIVAIKLIKDLFDGSQLPKYVVRELQIMHELSKMPDNIFTVKLHDIIIPCEDRDDLKSFNHIFIVMDFVELDMASLFQSNKPTEFTEEHLIYLLYNLLCSINFLETANVMHRDLKPSNILITDQCKVQICDFGFARTVPEELQKTDESDNQLNLPSTDHSCGDSENLSDRKPRFQSKDKKALESTDDSEGEQTKPTRKLTPHVFTRWYRPPEIILGQTDYDCKSDIWSVGCILSNLIQLTEDFQKSEQQPKSTKKDKYLFYGTSCYPMSPENFDKKSSKTKNANTITISEDDQLVKIIEVLGKEIDMSFIEGAEAKTYCHLVHDSVEHDVSKLLRRRFRASSNDIKELLQQMLQFNPHTRYSAAQLLEHKVFDSIRVKNIEKGAPYKVKLPQESKILQEINDIKSEELLLKKLHRCRKEIVRLADKYRKYS